MDHEELRTERGGPGGAKVSQVTHITSRTLRNRIFDLEEADSENMSGEFLQTFHVAKVIVLK
jgi:hypothetical protein